MANDDTRGRRGGYNDRPRPFQSRDRDSQGGGARDERPRDRNPWRGEGPEGAPPAAEGEQGWRPFERQERPDEGRDRGFGGDRGSRDSRGGPGGDRPPFRGAPGGDRPPFRGNDRPPFRSGPGGDRPPFRGNDRPPFRSGPSGNDRPPFRSGPGGDRPPFRGAPGGDRPPFRGNDRPPFRGDRDGEERRPFRGDRDGEERRPFAGRDSDGDHRPQGDRPPFQERGERPTYRQGRGGYRPFDQEAGGERPSFQDRRPGGDRPPFQGRRDDERPSFRGGPGGDRPFQGRRFDSDRPSGGRSFEGRRPGGDRPSFGDRRPSGGRPFEGREGGNRFEGQGRPLGTSTHAGRSPVNQFERIQADVYGRWPVLESLRAGNVTKIFMAAGVKDSADHLQEIQTIAAEKHITVVRVDRFDLDRVLGNVNHQGIAAACRPFSYTPFDQVVEAAKSSGEKPILVLFDGVQDPQNLGSIIRTAEAIGVDGAVLPKHNQAGVTPAVVRASAGAVEHLPIAEVTNLRQSVATLKEAGYWIVGLDMEGGTDYDNFDVDSPLALIIGGEGKGLGRVVADECDYLVKLPMRGKIGSLNASVAAGIVLYEIGRRRGTAGTPKTRASAIAAPAIAVDQAAEIEDEDLEDDVLDLELLEAEADEVEREDEEDIAEAGSLHLAEAEEIDFEINEDDEAEEDEALHASMADKESEPDGDSRTPAQDLPAENAPTQEFPLDKEEGDEIHEVKKDTAPDAPATAEVQPESLHAEAPEHPADAEHPHGMQP